MNQLLNKTSTSINLTTGIIEIDEFCLKDFAGIAKVRIPSIEFQNPSWDDILQISSSVWNNIDKFETDRDSAPINEKEVESILKSMYVMYIKWFCQNVYRRPNSTRAQLAAKVDTSLDAVRNYAKTNYNIDIKKIFLLDLLDKHPPAYPALLIFLPNGSSIIDTLKQELGATLGMALSQWEYNFAHIIQCRPYPQNKKALQTWEIVKKSILAERGICIKLYDPNDERWYQKIFKNKSFFDQILARSFRAFVPTTSIIKEMFQLTFGSVPFATSIFSDSTDQFIEYLKQIEPKNDYFYEITKFYILTLSKYLDLENHVISNIEDKDIVHGYITPFIGTYNTAISMRNSSFF
jgi:hypothetical protein